MFAQNTWLQKQVLHSSYFSFFFSEHESGKLQVSYSNHYKLMMKLTRFSLEPDNFYKITDRPPKALGKKSNITLLMAKYLLLFSRWLIFWIISLWGLKKTLFNVDDKNSSKTQQKGRCRSKVSLPIFTGQLGMHEKYILNVHFSFSLPLSVTRVIKYSYSREVPNPLFALFVSLWTRFWSDCKSNNLLGWLSWSCIETSSSMLEDLLWILDVPKISFYPLCWCIDPTGCKFGPTKLRRGPHGELVGEIKKAPFPPLWPISAWQHARLGTKLRLKVKLMDGWSGQRCKTSSNTSVEAYSFTEVCPLWDRSKSLCII